MYARPWWFGSKAMRRRCVGLGARDALRVDRAYPVHDGHHLHSWTLRTLYRCHSLIMGNPNLEVFKFGVYVFFPVIVYWHFGDPEWYERNVAPVRNAVVLLYPA